VLRNPFPAHEALREAGPVVWLEKYDAYAAARNAKVRQILSDPATFCSSRGVGLSDFQRGRPWRPPSLVLERDPPEHDRARAVLNRALSATVMRSLRARFAEAADELARTLARKGRFDAIGDCAEVYPMMVMPDAVGLSKEGREHLLPYAAMVFNMFGPDNELRRAAVAQMAPHVAWISAQCKREALADGGIGAMIPRRSGRGRSDAAGGGAPGPVAAHRRLRHDRSRPWRGAARACSQSQSIRRLARRSRKSARRVRGGGQA
jgi:cytochrome P450